MNTRIKQVPSKKGRIALQALKLAVSNALDRKRKLNQYAVVWNGEKPVHILNYPNKASR